jgi:hypothetical protein
MDDVIWRWLRRLCCAVRIHGYGPLQCRRSVIEVEIDGKAARLAIATAFTVCPDCGKEQVWSSTFGAPLTRTP